jgi:antitoxin MazE
MSMMIRTKVVKIGNSHGIRIPRALLEQAGLTGDVEMTVEGDKLIIHSASHARAGWESQFSAMAAQGDDHLIAELTPTQWDEAEWTW